MEAGEIWAAETNGELRIRPRIFGGRLGVPKIRAYRGLFPWARRLILPPLAKPAWGERRGREKVITYVVAKHLCWQSFFGVRRRVAAFQSGAKAPHSKKRLRKEILSVPSVFSG